MKQVRPPVTTDMVFEEIVATQPALAFPRKGPLRYKLSGAKHSNHEARMRDLEHLVRHGNVGKHAAEHRNQLTDVEEPVVAVLPEWSGIQKHWRKVT